MRAEVGRAWAWFGLVVLAVLAAALLPTPMPAPAPSVETRTETAPEDRATSETRLGAGGPADEHAGERAAPTTTFGAPVPPGAQATYGGAIRQTVTVRSAADLDGDGVRDRIRVAVTRPAERPAGARVPVVYQRDHAAATGQVPDLAGRYFVPRGYAVVSARLVPSGPPTVDPARARRIDDRVSVDVRQWLAGHRLGVDSAGRPVDADWSGEVAMIGCGGPTPCR
jgi:hypothetical protein